MRGTLALIPARSGSKGLPRKNIKNLGGHPVICWSIAACLKTKNIDRVIVSTDAPVYAEIARDAGAETPFLRPESISQDHSTDKEFIVHTINFLASKNEVPEYIVHIRPTTPFRDPNIIDQAIAEFKASSDATSLRSVHEMSESSYKTFEMSENNFLKPLAIGKNLDDSNNPRQVFPKTYFANGYVDVLSTSFVTQHDLIHGDQIMPFITPSTFEIDNEEDFNLLEQKLLANRDIAVNIFGE